MFFSLFVEASLAPFPFIIDPLEEEFSEQDNSLQRQQADKKNVPTKPEVQVPEEVTTKAFTPTQSETKPQSALFPVPKELESRVAFWVSVYAKYNSWEVIIHDTDFPELVYEVLVIKDIIDQNISYRAQMKKIHNIVNRRKQYYKTMLTDIQQKYNRNQLDKLSEEEKVLAQKFQAITDHNKYLEASKKKRMRMQLGQRDRFIEGIKNSGKYYKYIEDNFKNMDVPFELTRLIFVESMFNLKAHSKVGASGVWQFMRSTGKLFLEIGYAVDERRDPITASYAAAKLLKSNYEKLGTWPLAITAYNHGTLGMYRAAKKVGSNNIKDIIDKYKSRTFGFASKNFYTEFVAALDVEQNHKKYFGEIVKEPLIEFKEYPVPDFLSVEALQEHFDFPIERIKELNPALNEEVFTGHARIPMGHILKVPSGLLDKMVQNYENIPEKLKYKVQRRQNSYRVKSGDSLWLIARRHQVSIGKLMKANGMTSGRALRPGQILILP